MLAAALAIAASFSNCRRRQTAAVIVTARLELIMGCNNIADTSICDTCPRENAIAGKWGSNACSVVHAEANAISNAKAKDACMKGATMYCTYKPCIYCAKAIYEAGIVKVRYISDHTDTQAELFFEQKGIALGRGIHG